MIEILPVFGGVVTIVAVGLKIGRLLQKLDNAIEDIEEIKSDIREIKKQLNDLNVRVAAIEAKEKIIFPEK